MRSNSNQQTITSIGALFSVLFKIGPCRTCPSRRHPVSHLSNQEAVNARPKPVAFRSGVSISQEQHSMPRRLQFVSQLGRFGDVVRHGYIFATRASEYRKISCGCEI